MSEADILSFSDFAVRLNVKRSYVTQLKKEGRLVLTEDGRRVLVQASIELIQSTRDPSKAAVAQRHAAARGAKADGSTTGHESSDRGSVGIADEEPDHDYQVARAKREHYNAELAQMEFRKAAGDLMEAASVQTAVSGAVVALRTRIESWPMILAPQLVGRDEAAIVATLADHIEHALNEVANQFTKMGSNEAARS